MAVRATKKTAPVVKTKTRRPRPVKKQAEAAPEWTEPETPFKLPHALEISGIRNVYAQLREFIEQGGDKLVLDAGDVAIVDAAGIQLLIALFHSLKKEGFEIGWENYSVQIYQMAQEMALESRLGD